MSSDSFGARSTLEVGGRSYEIFRLDALADRFDVARLPYSIKVLLENVLRLEDGALGHRRRRRGDRRLGRGGRAQRRDPLPAGPGPDAGLHRRARGRRPGGDARRDGRDRRRPGEDQPAGRRRPRHRPLGPGRRLRQRARLRDQRRARVRAQPRALLVPQVGAGGLRQLQRRAAGDRDLPPGQPRAHRPGRLQPRARRRRCRPTPTPWSAPTRTRRWSTGSACSAGASAGSRPRRRCSASRSRCCCRRSSASSSAASCPQGATATDLVLTVTEMLRERGVVSKFVEFFGPGLATLGLADRATIGNMSPEFGSTCAIFPVDAETLRYLELTGRPTETLELVDAYAREQGMFHDEDSAGPGLLRHARARPRRGRARASPARSGPRTGCRWPTPRRPSSRRWRSSTPRPASRWATASTRRSKSPSRPPTRPPRTTTTSAASRARRSAAAPAATLERGQRRRDRGHPRGRHQLRARPRPGRDRGDHQLHQHLQPLGDGRRRAARPQRGRARASSASPG